MGERDILLFTRILTFEDMNITSGMSCAFLGTMENDLIKKYENFKRINIGENESVGRFIFFHDAFKDIGMKMRFQMI